MRVGFIVNASKHPDADSLYVEEVDLGEGRIRTVISGLVKHVPLDKVCLSLFSRVVSLSYYSFRISAKRSWVRLLCGVNCWSSLFTLHCSSHSAV